VLEVRDNGRGIREEERESPDAIGLLGIRERVLAWNGEIRIDGKAGEGTTVMVTIPLGRKESDQ